MESRMTVRQYRQQRSAPEPHQPERNFGQEAVLNGKKVVGW